MVKDLDKNIINILKNPKIELINNNIIKKILKNNINYIKLMREIYDLKYDHIIIPIYVLQRNMKIKKEILNKVLSKSQKWQYLYYLLDEEYFKGTTKIKRHAKYFRYALSFDLNPNDYQKLLTYNENIRNKHTTEYNIFDIIPDDDIIALEDFINEAMRISISKNNDIIKETIFRVPKILNNSKIFNIWLNKIFPRVEHNVCNDEIINIIKNNAIYKQCFIYEFLKYDNMFHWLFYKYYQTINIIGDIEVYKLLKNKDLSKYKFHNYAFYDNQQNYILTKLTVYNSDIELREAIYKNKLPLSIYKKYNPELFKSIENELMNDDYFLKRDYPKLFEKKYKKKDDIITFDSQDELLKYLKEK
jgi:hypothetical protein